MLLGAFLAFRVRKVPEAFNEGRYILIAVYNWVLVGIVFRVLLKSADINPDVNYALENVLVLFTTGVAFSVIFIPKFWLIYKNKGDKVCTFSKNSSDIPKLHSELDNGSSGETPSVLNRKSSAMIEAARNSLETIVTEEV